MRVRIINKKTKREIPNFMLHLYITYDKKGNMKCIDDEYEIQLEDEEKDELKWKLNEANEYINELNRENEDLRIYNETLEDELERLVDEDV